MWLWLLKFVPILSFLPALFSLVAEFLKPILGGLGSLIVWFIKEFAQGIKVVLTNLSTLTVVGSALFIGGWYGMHLNDKWILDKCEARNTQLELMIKARGKQVPKAPSSYLEWPFSW